MKNKEDETFKGNEQKAGWLVTRPTTPSPVRFPLTCSRNQVTSPFTLSSLPLHTPQPVKPTPGTNSRGFGIGCASYVTPHPSIASPFSNSLTYHHPESVPYIGHLLL